MTGESIIGSVGVQIVPDGRDFRSRVAAITKGLTADVRLDADTKKAQAELDAAAHDRESTIEAQADTKKADAELDRVARTRRASIVGDVKGFSGLTTGLLALGPALVPITAAATGLVAALGAPLAAAGGGATLYALIAGKAVKDTQKQSQAIDQLHKKVVTAQQAVDRASTPSGKKSALARLADDTKAYNDALGKLNPQQQKFIAAEGKLGDAFTKLERTAGPAIFGPLVSGMDALAAILPKLEPVLNPVSKAIEGLLDEVADSARQGALSDFIGFMAKLSGPAITGAGHVLGNIALGFGAIGKAFLPVSKSLGDSLLDWSQGFAKIGDSKGLSDFVGYVQREGPKVARTLGDVGGAIGHIAKAVAPIGDVGLSAISGLAKGVSKIPTGVLTAAAASLAGIAVSVKAIKLASSGASLLGKVGVLGKSGGAGLAEAALGRSAAKGVVPVYVTNPGFGGAGGPGEKKPSGGLLGGIGKILGPLTVGGFIGEIANSMGLNPFKNGAENGGLHKAVLVPGTTASSSQAEIKAAFARQKAIKQTKEQAAAQKALNTLLLSPALPDYGKALRSLPKAVQTKIATPGAVDSYADVTKLAKQYDLTPKQIKTVIALTGLQDSLTGVQRLQRQIAGLHDKHVNVTVGLNGASHALAVIGQIRSAQVDNRAKGGLLSGPGTGTSDSMLIRASNGEYVMRAAAVDRYGVGFFDALNAERYAEGGHVGLRPGDQSTAKDKKKPLFTHEGPRWYHAAYKHNRPFALAGPSHWDWPYQTGLDSQKNANAFAEWVRKKHVPFDLSARIVDYDMRGYWKKTKGRGWHRGSHFPDTFKTPYDTTFSHESKYATKDNPFYWHGNKLVDTRNGQVIFAANGGYMMGPGGPRDDLIPAWLSNGEYVVRAAAVQRYGVGLFNALNAERFASGGQAGNRKAIASARSGFDPSFDMSTKQLRHEFDSLAMVIRKHGGHLGDSFTRLEAKTVKLDKQWGSTTDKLSKVTSRLDSLRSQRDSLKSTVGDSLTSNPFASTNVWSASAGGAGILGTLRADIAHAGQFNKLAAQLKKNGVHGKALAYAESQGLGALQQLAGLDPAQQKQFQALFVKRANAIGSAEKTAASSLAPYIKAAQADAKELRAELKASRQELREIKQAIRHVAKPIGEAVGEALDGVAGNVKKRSG